ncbi:MAG: 4-hydroxy-tetrahydrodipicolinate synthase [Bacteroidetes bacterium]|nr:MAG: 4-hydroxy-tetrahydrodipicolinate synthase [Bacteroidota bacterium]
MNKFRGTGVAIVTPFKANNEVDFEGLENVTNHIINGKCEYIVILGTTGETATLNKQEKQQVVDTIKRVNNGRVPLVMGIGGNNTAEILETIAHFDFTGFDAVLSVSPYYNKPNQQGLIHHYTVIADACPVPVILYNVPGRTGSNMTAATTLTLAKHPNIIGMKEASGNMEQCMAIIKNKPDDFLVISGDDALTLPLIGAGMDGVISVIANAYPADWSEMVRLALAGDFVAARKLHYKLLDLSITIFADGSPGGIKELLNYMNICGTHVRLPLYPVNDEVKNKLLDLAKNY